MARSQREHWSPAWLVVIAALTCVAVVLAKRAGLLPFEAWGMPLIAVAGAALTALFTIGQDGRLLTHFARAVAWMAAGAWTPWAVVVGWTPWVWLALACGTAVLIGLLHLGYIALPAQSGGDSADDQQDRRPQALRQWESDIRGTVREPVTVTSLTPWARPADGVRVHLDLPIGMKWTDFTADICGRLQAARKLKPGCLIRAMEADDQGSAILDVMLRDCLVDEVMVQEGTDPASIYHEFTLMTAPHGEPLDACLRSQSMVIGGAPDSGKTTLLHRIIMFLARCTDALVWVVDTNGGGVAEPWVSPWAQGRARRPIVDWVADTEEEAAVLMAVATAVVRDRKTSREATRRKRAANTTVLPVDADLPAIVVLNDEGGEMRQAVSLLGQIADAGLSRLAQIGRAEGGRVIKSVLRGTADLLDKGMRVNAAIRLCLRMEEEDEYTHVLGADPGRTRLLHKGSGYLRRPSDPKPIFGRTVNVLLDAMDRHAVACADLRPDLDDRGQLVASRVRMRDVLGGRDPESFADLAALPVMRDVQAGRAYAGRWDRYAHKLAEMRGEDVAEVESQADTPPSSSQTPTQPSVGNGGPSGLIGPAMAALFAARGHSTTVAETPKKPVVDLDDPGSVDREAARLLAELDWHERSQQPTVEPTAKVTTREHILAILDEAHPGTLTSAQIGVRLGRREVNVGRTYRQDVLRAMRESTPPEVVQTPGGAYTVPEK